MLNKQKTKIPGQIKIILKLFLAVCFIWSFFKIQGLFKVNNYTIYQGVKGFYAEPENTLDAVFIGASNVHAFWQPAAAWRDHGISVFSFSIDSLRIQSLPYMLAQAHKRQPQALLIVNLNSFQTTLVSDVSVHWTTNYLPFSIEKIKLINKLSKAAGYTGLDQLQFYFPIIRFHSSWKELTTSRFTRKLDGMKHSLTFTKYLNDSVNLAKDFYITEEEAEITAAQKQILNELLDFCDENDLNVLFVSVPFALGKDHKFNKQLNYMGNIIQERGYPYLSLTKTVNDMGILPETDFYNNKHTNVHGSLKITEYMARYLISRYGFTDKRGLPGWESWDKAAELYNDYISPYTLPFEREHAERNYDLAAPALNKLKIDGQTIIVSWKASEGADAYDIYRKSNIGNEKNWAFIASTDAQTLQFTDNGLRSEKRYTYTVVPKQLSSGTEYYGQFNFSGITGITK